MADASDDDASAATTAKTDKQQQQQQAKKKRKRAKNRNKKTPQQPATDTESASTSQTVSQSQSSTSSPVKKEKQKQTEKQKQKQKQKAGAEQDAWNTDSGDDDDDDDDDGSGLTYTLEQTLNGSARKWARKSKYGSSIAIGNQNELFVGASAFGDSYDGAVFLMNYNEQWTQSQKITPPTAETGERFGHDLAYDAATNMLLVGAPLYDSSRGRAHLFEFDASMGEWTLSKTFNNSRPHSIMDSCGWSVAIDQSIIVLGCHKDNTDGGNGAVRIIDEEWTETKIDYQRIRGGVGRDIRSGFGHAVSIANGVIAISAPMRDGTFEDQGAVYIVRKVGDTWTMDGQPTFESPAAKKNGFFGRSLDLDYDEDADPPLYTLAIGTSGEDKAYIYESVDGGVSWSDPPVKFQGDVDEYDEFGKSIALSGNTFMVEAYRLGADRVPSVFVFQKINSSWSTTFTQKLSPPVGTGSGFAGSIAIKNNLVSITVCEYPRPNGKPLYKRDAGSVHLYANTEWRTIHAHHRRLKTTWSPERMENRDINAIAIESETIIIVIGLVGIIGGLFLYYRKYCARKETKYAQ